MGSMTARRSRRLAVAAGAALLLGLTVPASRAQEQPFPNSLTLTPPSDSATAGTCNEFTARVTAFENTPVSGVTVDVRQVVQNAGLEPDETRELSFCNPANASGANPTGQGGTAFGDVSGNNDTSTPGVAGRHTDVHGEVGPTDANGEVTFGIAIAPTSSSGEVEVTAWVEGQDDDALAVEGEPSDESTKTWTPAPEPPPASLDAAPETASAPNGGSHQVTVTLTAGGNPVTGQVPSSLVTTDATGRPAGDVADPGAGPSPNATATYTCPASDAQGMSSCTFQDPVGTGPGTDTVVFFLDEGAAGLDAGDPQDAVQVAWFQPQPPPPTATPTPTPTPGPSTPEARNVELCHGTAATPVCDTSPATREPGEEHSLTVRVTGRDGTGLSGVPVELRERGPAGFLPGGNSVLVTTAADGTAGATLSTQELGTSTIVAEISPPGTAGSQRGPAADDDECEQPAGPSGVPPAGNCVSRALQVSWVVVECADGLDNDADGFTDLDDPGCTSEDDVSELPVNLVHHDRRTNMRFRDWVGPGDEGLVIFGRLRLTGDDDHFSKCTHRQPMLIQRRVDGEWNTVKDARTNATGRWTGVVFDVPGPYRAVAPRVEIDVDGVLHVCFSAHKVKTHHHRR